MKHLLENRRIVVGLTGGIACYKTCELVSRLTQLGARVRVAMTRNACRFVGPVTLQALSGSPVALDLFEQPADPGGIDHVRLADFAEALVITPATADFLAKMAHGIADDLLSTLYVACDCPVLAVPAMNTRMFEHPATRANLELLERRGVHLLLPVSGRLACGTEGVGRLPEWERIAEKLGQVLGAGKLLTGRRVLVTAGPTHEPLDPVRYLTNRSSGRMGFALARAAVRLGAQSVRLVTGPSQLPTPLGVERLEIATAREMLAEVERLTPESDLVIAAAAVSDWRPSQNHPHKLRKQQAGERFALELEANPDILAWAAGHRRPGAVVVGFALETEHEIEHALDKLRRKGADLMVVNNPLEIGAGFEVETNRVAVLRPDGGCEELPLLDKEQLAGLLLERAAELF